MESYTPNPFEDNNKPDETGDSETSKKKKKKRTRVPLPIEKSDSAAEQKQRQQKEQEKRRQGDQETAESKTDAPEAEASEAEVLEPDAVPDAEMQSDADQSEQAPNEEFQGELVIDHSDEELVLPEAAEAGEHKADAEQLTNRQEAWQTPAASNQEALPATEDPVPVPPPFWHDVPLWPQNTARNEAVHQQADGSQVYPESAGVERIIHANQAGAAAERPGEPVVTRKDAARQAYRAEKRGLSRGVASGALAGWWLGRRSIRQQAERVFRTRQERSDQDVQRLEREVGNLEQTVAKRENVIRRTQEKLQEFISRTRSVQEQQRHEQSPQPIRAEAPLQERKAAMAAERPQISPIKPEIKRETPAEKLRPQPEQSPAGEQADRPPAGHRYETSAWHRIEVDEKTGRLAEKPSFEYGEAFHREQQQEKLVQSAAKAQTAAQVGMTLLAAGSISGQQTPSQTTPDQSGSSKSARSGQLKTLLQDTEYIRHQLVQNATNPSIWGIALAAVVFLFLLGIVG